MDDLFSARAPARPAPAELTAELLVERFAEIGRVYEMRWPHRPDGWMLAGGLDLTVGDLRAAIALSDKRDRERRARSAGGI